MNFSFWLIPKKPCLDFFQKIIKQLAEKYQACPFTPHVTIYHFENDINPRKVIEMLKNNFDFKGEIILELEDVKHSDMFTKTFYCQMKNNSQLQKLYKKMKKLFCQFPVYQINPHLSLIYKNNMKVKDKIKERKKFLPIIPKKTAFNKIKLIIREKGSIKKEKDVLEWKEILTINLS